MSAKQLIGKGVAGVLLGFIFIAGLFMAGAATGMNNPDLIDAGANSAPTIDAGMPANVPVLDDSPIEFGRFVKSMWKSGAILPALIVAVFALLIVAKKRIPWLNEGKRAVYSAAAFTFLATIAEPASRGTTPTINMVIAAIGAALALVLRPIPKAQE